MGMGQVGLPLTVWRALGGGLSNVAVAYALGGGGLILVLLMAETYKKFKVSNNNLKKILRNLKNRKKYDNLGGLEGLISNRY